MTVGDVPASEGDRIARRNAIVLSIASALAGANATVVFATAALAGHSLSGRLDLATIPASTFVLGMMAATLPVAFAAKRFGRRATFMGGNIAGAWAGLLSALAILVGSFALFCFATFLAGLYQAVTQSYRYAAADTATDAFRPKAISWVLTGGVLAAVLGPQLVIWTKDLLPPSLFVATYLAQAAVAMLCMVVTVRFVDQERTVVLGGTQRPLRAILASKRLRVAILCGAVAQASMNFIMTVAPLAMAMCGYSVVDSALGIQWHVLAMFAPSFITGSLILRYGKAPVVAAGLAILLGCGVVNLMGITVMHFWVGLVLLGVGWNLAYIGATAMVTDHHSPAERAKVQGLNDFIIFGLTAAGSFAAGAVLSSFGWAMVNWALLPLAALCLVAVLVFGQAPRPMVVESRAAG